MPEVILNQIENDQPNLVVYCDDLMKPELLRLMAEISKYPDRYQLAIADKLPLTEEVQPRDYLTIGEWLEEIDVEIPTGWKHRLSRRASEKYQELYGTKPRIVFRPDSQGRYRIRAQGYAPNQLYILEDIFTDIAEKNPSNFRDLLRGAKSDLAQRVLEKLIRPINR